MHRFDSILSVVLVSISVIFSSPEAFAQPDSAAMRQDRTTFNRLGEQLRRLEADYAKALDAATDEARRGGVTAAGPAQASLLSIRDQRDRILDRLILLSVRHGWPLPTDEGADSRDAGAPQSEKDRIFVGARIAVQGRLAEEARAAASVIRLPLLPLDTIRAGG